MKSNRTVQCLAFIAMLGSTPIVAAAPEWRVVLSERSSTVFLPQLPSGSYVLSTILPGEISNSAAATLSFNLTRPDGRAGLWVERNSILLPQAEIGITGAAGPGRTGIESTHVFRQMAKIDSNAQDQRVFAARADDPAQPFESTSYGVWIANSNGNQEIARDNAEGSLGPGIGTNWVFIPDSDFFPLTDFGNLSRIHALPNGQVLLDAVVRPPPGQPYTARRALVRHTPGVGNVPCAVALVPDAALAPGVLLGDQFNALSRAASNARGEIYAAGGLEVGAPTFETRLGIWKFCDGAPQVKALSANTGALGPNIAGSPTATFNRFGRIIGPTSAGAFYFSGEGSPTFKGVFHHSNGQNRPVLLNNAAGTLGPGIAGFSFNFVLDYEPLSAGRFGLIYATMRSNSGSTERFGLWRLQPDAASEPILIIGDNGAYAPAPGRLWESVSAFNILENGVALAIAATTTPPSAQRRLSVWRFRPGRAPEEILKSGDLVRYPTATGIEMRAVRGISGTFVGSGSDGLQDYPGDDSWVSASGSVLVEVELEGMEGLIYPTRYLRAQISNVNVLFEDGFE
jgi:hypothetical protein